MDRRPPLDWTQVAGLPVRVLRLQGKGGFNGKGERGLVVKAYVHAVVSGANEHFNKVHGLALDIMELVEGASLIAADGGFASFGLGKAQGIRDALAFFGLFRASMLSGGVLLVGAGLRRGNRAFTFNNSHIAS